MLVSNHILHIPVIFSFGYSHDLLRSSPHLITPGTFVLCFLFFKDLHTEALLFRLTHLRYQL